MVMASDTETGSNFGGGGKGGGEGCADLKASEKSASVFLDNLRSA